MTTVGEFMTTRGLVTMDGTDTLTAAAQEMRDSAIGDVIVTNGDRVVGIVTDRDITVRGVAEGLDPTTATLNEILTQDVVTVSQYDDAVAAADLMRTYGVRRLPVVEDGRLIGLVSLGDLAVEREPQSVLADISADEPNN
jgi:CBS domain-containing protein